MEKKLQKYIDELEKDILKLKGKRHHGIRNIINESDIQLLTDVKEDLIRILGGN